MNTIPNPAASCGLAARRGRGADRRHPRLVAPLRERPSGARLAAVRVALSQGAASASDPGEDALSTLVSRDVSPLERDVVNGEAYLSKIFIQKRDRAWSTSVRFYPGNIRADFRRLPACKSLRHQRLDAVLSGRSSHARQGHRCSPPRQRLRRNGRPRRFGGYHRLRRCTYRGRQLAAQDHVRSR